METDENFDPLETDEHFHRLYAARMAEIAERNAEKKAARMAEIAERNAEEKKNQEQRELQLQQEALARILANRKAQRDAKLKGQQLEYMRACLGRM
jgi:CHASE2 domain-containing sensor protein